MKFLNPSGFKTAVYPLFNRFLKCSGLIMATVVSSLIGENQFTHICACRRFLKEESSRPQINKELCSEEVSLIWQL